MDPGQEGRSQDEGTHTLAQQIGAGGYFFGFPNCLLDDIDYLLGTGKFACEASSGSTASEGSTGTIGIVEDGGLNRIRIWSTRSLDVRENTGVLPDSWEGFSDADTLGPIDGVPASALRFLSGVYLLEVPGELESGSVFDANLAGWHGGSSLGGGDEKGGGDSLHLVLLISNY